MIRKATEINIQKKLMENMGTNSAKYEANYFMVNI
jgi:hypothetical protein